MSLRPELFQMLAHLRRLPGGEQDWQDWQKAYEAAEDLIATLDEEEFGKEEPALVFLPGEQGSALTGPVEVGPESHPVDGGIGELSVASAVNLIRRGELSPLELVRAVLDRIAAHDKTLNAYIACQAEQAIQAARRAEDAIAHGRPLGPLHGIPVAVKDLFFTAAFPTTVGTRVLTDHIPREDATVIRSLMDAGAILLGKLNLHELAYGITSDNPHFGPVRNPWDLTRISGGSSGGSVAAVAVSLCLASLGTDTGGSIRIPAACCGVVGLKPTYGRVSRNGVFPLAWSLDHVGPITKTVEDAASVLQVVAGPDPQDPTASHVSIP
ncbi:MAG: amidase, partial [Candidatus Methylomirabilales bacterium]